MSLFLSKRKQGNVRNLPQIRENNLKWVETLILFYDFYKLIREISGDVVCIKYWELFWVNIPRKHLYCFAKQKL